MFEYRTKNNLWVYLKAHICAHPEQNFVNAI